MILLIDNYDSFTYNLYHYLIQAGGAKVEVKRNDQISLQEIKKLKPRAIVISPGPCAPDQAGICLSVIEEFKAEISILGVCLGHQAIGQAFGGKIVKTYPMHGKVDNIYHYDQGIFHALPNPFKATRYHSLIIERATLPPCFKITAESKDGTIMGIEHQDYNIHGVQFHPESIASECGLELIENFLKKV